MAQQPYQNVYKRAIKILRRRQGIKVLNKNHSYTQQVRARHLIWSNFLYPPNQKITSEQLKSDYTYNAYNCKTWNAPVRELHMLQTFIHRCLRIILFFYFRSKRFPMNPSGKAQIVILLYKNRTLFEVKSRKREVDRLTHGDEK